MGADGRGWTRIDADQFPHPETPPEDGPSPFPLRESPRPCLAPSPSANPNGIMSVGMDVDQFPHPETPEDGPSPFPLRESQRDSATKPGVAPPRRYPGSMPNISTTLTGLCKRAVHSGQFLGRTFQSRQSSSIPMMVQIRTAHSPASQPWFWAMDPRPLPWTTRPT